MKRPRLWLATALVLTAVLSVVRAPDRLSSPQFWAEDAAVFFIQAEVNGAGSIAAPYAGYILLLPRLVAYAGRLVPVVHVPGLYAVASFGVLALAVCAAFWATRDRPAWARLAFGLALLTVPFVDEVWSVLTNTQWIGAAAMVAIIGAPSPATPAARGLVLAFLALIAFTGPFALVLLPCALLVAWRAKDGWTMTLVAMLAVAALVCLATLAASSRGGMELSIPARLAAFAVGRTKLFAGTSLAAATLAWGAWIGYRRGDRLLLTCGTSGLLLLGAVAAAAPVVMVGAVPHIGGRYAFVPWVTVVWTLILQSAHGSRLSRAGLTAVAGVCAVGLPVAPLTLHDWRADARCLERQPACMVTVNPGWDLLLPGRGADP